MALTVEVLTIEIGRALEPLNQRLSSGDVDLLFGEIGLPTPDVIAAAPGVVSAIGNIVGELDTIPSAVNALVAAVDGGDVSAIVDAVKIVVPLVTASIDAIDPLRTAIEAAAPGPGQAELLAVTAELPERLLGYTVATYLQRHQPTIGGLAELLGLIDVRSQPATANRPAHITRLLRLDRLSQIFDDFPGLLGDVYGWGSAGFNWDLFLARLAKFATRISSFAFVQPGAPGEPAVLRVGFFDIGQTMDTIPGVRFALRAEIAEQADTVIPLAPGVALELTAGAALEAGTGLDLLPPSTLNVVPPSAQVDGLARIGISITGADGGPVTLLGLAGGTSITAGRVRASAGAAVEWDIGTQIGEGEFIAEAAIEDGAIAISLDGADGFLSTILPDGGLTFDFDVLAGWSSNRGLYFEGGAGIEIDLPVDLDLGAIKIQMLHIGLGLSPHGIELEASGAISAQLGPFAMAVERMGTTAELTFPDNGGNLGVANLDFSFKPPSGIGLSLDAGVVKGGGYLYFDVDAGEYAGVLELTLGPVSIKAIGILTTELPNGADGWALLMLVFAEFNAVQLGFGFTLNGVGGIIGLQHGVSIDELQSGLRTGVLDSVLFPNDPVANAPALLGQLRTVFPIVPRALTIGPALKIGWSTPALVTVSLGIVLQFDDVLGSGGGPPSISRIVLVGQIKVQIPPVDELGIDAPALIHLQVDIVGAYDFNEQLLSIDAVLRDSHVALLPLTGSLVVRAGFGDNPTFVLAVGGFHPRFTDLPPGLPPQDRVGLQLDYDIITVRIVGYTAITSNSFQIGAEASLVAAAAGFRVEAYLGFDALFIFEPVFRFEIDFRVGASIKWKSFNLASIDVRGLLKGPGRWEVAGHASISVLWWDVGIDFEVAWGSAPAPELPSVSVGNQIAAALSAQSAWAATTSTANAIMSIRALEPTDDVIAHPLGELVAMQKVVPLGVDIDRVGRSVPSDGNRFEITNVQIGGVSETPNLRKEHFARGEFLDLSEQEKLSTPSFEQFDAGVAIATDDYTVGSDQIAFEPEWETAYLRQERPSVFAVVHADLLVAQTALSAVAAAPLRADRPLMPAVPPRVRLDQVEYVADVGGGAPATSFTEAQQGALVAGRDNSALLVTEFAEVLTR